MSSMNSREYIVGQYFEDLYKFNQLISYIMVQVDHFEGMRSNFFSSRDFSHLIFSFSVLQSASFFLRSLSRVVNYSVRTAIFLSNPFFIFSISSTRAYSQLPDLGAGAFSLLPESLAAFSCASSELILTLSSMDTSQVLSFQLVRYLICSAYFSSISLKVSFGDSVGSVKLVFFSATLLFSFSFYCSRFFSCSLSELSCSSSAVSLEFSVLSWLISSLVSSLPFSWVFREEPPRFLRSDQAPQTSLDLSRRTWVIWKVPEEQELLAMSERMPLDLCEFLPSSSNISSYCRKWMICSSVILLMTRSRFPAIFHSFRKPASQLSTPICFRILTSSSSRSACPCVSLSHFLSAPTQPFCSPLSPCRILLSLSSRLISSSMEATSLRREVAITGSDWLMSTDRRNSSRLLSIPEAGRSRGRFLKPVELPSAELLWKPFEPFIMTNQFQNIKKLDLIK